MQPRTFIDRVFWYVGGVLMLAMTGVMIYALTARYFFNKPPLWSEDVPRTIFVWMSMITLGLAIKLGLNIRVTTLLDIMPRTVRLWTEIVMHVLVLGMIALLIWFTLPIMRLKSSAVMLSTGWSEAVLVAPMIVGFALAFVYQLRALLRTVQALRSGAEIDVEHQSGAGMG
jgi:TRAP-type C4-dicarboxylate transport system permease small subunit